MTRSDCRVYGVDDLVVSVRVTWQVVGSIDSTGDVSNITITCLSLYPRKRPLQRNHRR